MKPETCTPTDLFKGQIRYIIPLYQRPYVWNKTEQWEPLWEDVRGLADMVHAHSEGVGHAPIPPHFLGAIVIDQLPSSVKHVGARAVIDGQQRLTTLQILLDAAQEVVEARGDKRDAKALRALVENDAEVVTSDDHLFKVWPTDRDQNAFRAAMRNDITPNAEQKAVPIGQAHAYFAKVIREWAGDDESTLDRLSSLTEALAEQLKLVVINLEPGDNAQVIFETLNHRGAPLLAADLIKNLVFQVADSRGLDVAALYAKYWRDLDAEYWRQRVAQGRFYRPRIDVFVNRWLVMNLRREVKSHNVFTEFRDSIIMAPGVDIEDVLARLAADAAVHKGWESLDPTSPEGLFRYRVLEALDSQVVAPLFLWLTRHTEEQMPAGQRLKALRSVESWMIRRMLVRATAKDYNNLVIDLLGALQDSGPEVAGDTIEELLAAGSAESRFWPDDGLVRSSVCKERIYATMTRARVRMLLEALEDATRTALGEGQPSPRGLTIEHVMPQGWRSYWDDDAASQNPAMAEARDALVHTLGNLSLVTGRLNPTLSNRPWTDADAHSKGLGSKGKRSYLLENSNLKLNARLVSENEKAWTEDDIRARTTKSLDSLLTLWPIPTGAAKPQSVASEPDKVAPVSAGDVGDELIATGSDWVTSEAALADARTLWSNLSPAGIRLLEILVAVSPDQVEAEALAAEVGLETGAYGVAGVLSGVAKCARDLGRPVPVDWTSGDSSAYWVAAQTAATLDAGRS